MLRQGIKRAVVHAKAGTGSPSIFARNMTITKKDLNPQVVNAQYAVRGKLAVRADEIKEQMRTNPSLFPFDKVINANIGNPQQLDQKPVTFYRQVLAMLQYPELMDKAADIGIPKDAVQRAQKLLDDIGSVGAYSSSQGVAVVRDSVANFIEKRDGYPAQASDIYLTTGASNAVTFLLTTLARGDGSDGFMIPIPQYPLYTATLTLQNSNPVPYYLDEAKEWGTNMAALNEAVESSNHKLKAVVVINPGNPTGACLGVQEIKDILLLAQKEGIAVIADEVYQANIFASGQFHSFKKVWAMLKEENPDFNVALASLHSTSKGKIGECGQRGGYMELVGFHDDVVEQIFKLCSISLCPVVTGQALIECMVNPPVEGDESFPLFDKETNHIMDTLTQRANRLYEAFKEMPKVSCEPPQGAMYLFPSIELPAGAIAEAERHNEKPDEFYCMKLLEETGICVIPGSGFGQKDGTYHFRTTFLAPGDDYGEKIVSFHKKFLSQYE
ncbi:putative alanine aminotransferase [Yarrowia sp. C11]|nr:putative alanine aminotransferase [Yarrowia sp. E02]KAG5369397.1 putative alanine aminotransferase [Yarrowia sp. C11]